MFALRRRASTPGPRDRRRSDLGAEDAAKLGMHMSDWIGDAAFLFALHLFPDRFSDDEVRDGIGKFLGHAPNHIRAACGITGSYVWESFPDEDEDV